MEEGRVFPAAAQAYPTQHILDCLAGLRQEHNTLLEQAQQFNTPISTAGVVQSPNQYLNRQLMQFFVKLGHHALREDELFKEINRLIYSIGTG